MPASNIPPPRDHDKLRSALAALPHVGEGSDDLLDGKAALAAFFRIKNMGSGLSDRISLHIDDLLREAVAQIEPVPDVEGAYALTAIELKGIIANAAIRGAMQAASDIGRSNLDIESILETIQDPFRSTDVCGDGGDPPRAA